MRINDDGVDRVYVGLLRGDRADRAARGREKAVPAGRTREGREELTPERIAEVRRRILEGAYDSVEVVERIAVSILQHGDL